MKSNILEELCVRVKLKHKGDDAKSLGKAEATLAQAGKAGARERSHVGVPFGTPGKVLGALRIRKQNTKSIKMRKIWTRGGNLPNRASSPGPQLTSKYYTCKDRTTIKDSVVSMEEICCKYDKGITHNSQLRGVTRESASPCEMKNNFKKGEKTDPIEGGMKMFRSQNVQGLAKRQRQNSTMKIMCYLANF